MVGRLLRLSKVGVAKTVMVMGTSSSAGKSLLTTALCRCLARRGFRVAPFKAQNMSNNAAVCAGGGEIGRSQALQAIAAGTPPTVDMNPVLLKPEGQTRSQVVVDGLPTQTLEAVDYFERRSQLWPHVTAALDRLRQHHDIIVIEGAGSPAELNLADVEMVNMSVARYCRSPVLLIGDIERGGVFAQLLGTLWLLTPADRALVKGLIVNKFRGDLSLFDAGVEILQQRGGVEVLGVLPYIEALRLPEEDAVALDGFTCEMECSGDGSLDIAIIRLPHIANFDDFDPLAADASVRVRYVRSADQWGDPDVVILPGTKNTFGDLQWMRQTGLADKTQQHALAGGHVVGICGGYQMLGERIHNPHRLEGGSKEIEGLGLLPVETTFLLTKQTRLVELALTDDSLAPGTLGETISGYEIHHGATRTSSAWLRHVCSDAEDAESRAEGSQSGDGRVWGCYLHGLFYNDRWRRAWLTKLGVAASREPATSSHDQLQRSLDRLADTFETHIDIDHLLSIIFES